MLTVQKITRVGLLAGAALAVAVAFATVGSSESVAHEHGKRGQAMKSIGGAMKGLGEAVGGGNAAEAQKLALQISTLAAQIPGMFEGGSAGEKSRAKAEIWSNWDDFKAKAAATQAAADVVAANASAGSLGSDPKAVVGSIGATCGACHKAYRGPEIK
jgi:cytochrome c556